MHVVRPNIILTHQASTIIATTRSEERESYQLQSVGMLAKAHQWKINRAYGAMSTGIERKPSKHDVAPYNKRRIDRTKYRPTIGNQDTRSIHIDTDFGIEVQALAEWSERMCKEDAPLIKMGMAWPAMALNIDEITIKELQGGQTAKAMFPTDGPHRQEAVFTVEGVLKAKDLPPVKGSRQVFRCFVNMASLTQQRHSLKADRLQYACQHATLAGWDAPSFKKVLQNMQEATYTMYSASGRDVIEPWRT
ncbi:hypothetical protein B0H14DRAFT_2590811 [Mycena olivaceomarginata]|nr:hypothetical protein B0H14DRAFT_2590811 [Mycena olivaceomarginata]